MKNHKFSISNQDLMLTPNAQYFENHKITRKKQENLNQASKRSLFDKDSVQNLNGWEAGLRGVLVVFMPFLCSIDLYNGTNTMFFIAPVIFYLEVTALTLTCPIKSIFLKKKQNGPIEL